MKLDNILLKFAGYPKSENPRPKDFIKSDFAYKTDKLVVLLPGWCVTPKQNRILMDKIKKFSILSYTFSSDILTSDYKSTLNCFQSIKAKVQKDIRDLRKRHNFSEIMVIGVSLGCVNACMVANDNKLVDKMYLITPGHCLAESLWYGIGTDSIKKEFENKGITLSALKKYWQQLAPENNIDRLQGKEIRIFVSKSDIIIPYSYGKKLFELLKKKKYVVQYSENIFYGHLLTAYLFYLNPNKYLNG
jgi:esterase/lipase